MSDWSRNDKLAFAGVAVSILGIGIALIQPVLGRGEPININMSKTVDSPQDTMRGVDSHGSPFTINIDKTVVVPPAPKTQKIIVEIPGSNNNIQILPLKAGKGQAQELNIIGDGGDQTVFVAPGQTAEINVPGSNNTIRVARSLTAQVTYNAMGMKNTETIVDDPK